MAAEAARITAPGIDRTSAWDKNSNSVWCNGGANLDIVPSTNVVAIRRFSQNQLVADTGAAESEPTTLGLRGRVDPNSRKRSQGVAVDSKRSQIHQVGEGAPATLRQKLHPKSQPFGALVVQASPEAGGSGSGLIGPYLTAREVAARLRVCTATVYRLCDAGELMHVRVSNAVRVGEGDLRAFLQRGRR